MQFIARAELLAEIWQALNAPIVPRRQQTIKELSAKFIKQGWADIYDIQDIVWAMDGRFADHKIGDLVRALNIPMRAIYRRPGYRERECWGSQTLATSDVAWLLIQMEQLGFEVDPTILVKPLLQKLKRSSHLNDA